MLKTNYYIPLDERNCQAIQTKDGLEENERQLLLALARAVNFSLSGHVPKQAITSRFRRDLRGSAKSYLKILMRSGLVAMHPTGGEMTWQLTRKGLLLALEITCEPQNIYS